MSKPAPHQRFIIHARPEGWERPAPWQDYKKDEACQARRKLDDAMRRLEEERAVRQARAECWECES